MIDERSFCELFQNTVANHADRPALRDFERMQSYTWAEYGARVHRVAAGLHALGVRHGDTVGLMMSNRPEFHIVDMAAAHLGAVPFSVYNTNSAEQIAFLFSNAENKVVVCEEQYVECVTQAAQGSQIESILRVEDLADIEAAGDLAFDFEAAWRAVTPEDLLTIIYTSGTTGPPKGVELTHANVVFSVDSAMGLPTLERGADLGRVISYLPDAHLANRWVAHYIPTVKAGEIVTLANAKEIGAAMADVRPTAFLGVPMVWYKFKAAVDQAAAGTPGPRGRLLRWAIATGAKPEAKSGAVSVLDKARCALADRLVLSKLRAKVGLDEVIHAATGAAPISVDALHFFDRLGITIAEGWGMSEGCVVGTSNRMDAIKPGTVGPALPGVEVRLGEDGELLVRSRGVMRGYRNNPQQTAAAVDQDGWLHTGDIATIDDEGYVSIVDRKKELIINEAGKNMSPSNIEGAVIVECGLISSVVVVGDRRPYIVALIAVDPDGSKGLDDTAVEAEIAAAVDRANSKLSRVEHVRKYKIIREPWLPGGDELTPTMKLRRKPIGQKYAAEIEALYES